MSARKAGTYAGERYRAGLRSYLRRVTISDSGHDTYSAWRERDHDDLVLALCLAAWTAENKPFGITRVSMAKGRIPTHITDYRRYRPSI